MVPDRALYHVGDVARVLVAAPRPGMTALVTIERGRVYSHQVLRLSGASPVVRIPILPGYLPNVFVSVVAVSGTGAHAGIPLWKMGVAELPVDVRARRLRLTLRAGARLSITVNLTTGERLDRWDVADLWWNPPDQWLPGAEETVDVPDIPLRKFVSWQAEWTTRN